MNGMKKEATVQSRKKAEEGAKSALKNESPKGKRKKAVTDSRKSGAVCKLPAGTPASAATPVTDHGADTTTDPPVPNRAHTEM